MRKTKAYESVLLYCLGRLFALQILEYQDKAQACFATTSVTRKTLKNSHLEFIFPSLI